MDRANPSAKTVTAVKSAYHAFITCYKEKGTTDEFFTGKNRLIHLKVFQKLKDNRIKYN